MKDLIGLRTLKTGISVGLAVAMSLLLMGETGFFAAIGAVITMQSTIADSVSKGKERMVGTIIGIFLGVVFAKITFLPLYVLEGVGIIVVIVVCNLLKWKDSIFLGTIAFSAILLNMNGQGVLDYAPRRFFETLLGIAIGVGVNLLIKPPNLEKRLEDSIIPLENEILDLFYSSTRRYFKSEVTGETPEKQIKKILAFFQKVQTLLGQLKKEDEFLDHGKKSYFEDAHDTLSDMFDQAQQFSKISQDASPKTKRLYFSVAEGVDAFIRISANLPALLETDIVATYRPHLGEIRYRVQEVLHSNDVSEELLEIAKEGFTAMYHAERFIQGVDALGRLKRLDLEK